MFVPITDEETGHTAKSVEEAEIQSHIRHYSKAPGLACLVTKLNQVTLQDW